MNLTTEKYCCMHPHLCTPTQDSCLMKKKGKRMEVKKESLCNQCHTQHVFPAQGLFLSSSSLKHLLTTELIQCRMSLKT